MAYLGRDINQPSTVLRPVVTTLTVDETVSAAVGTFSSTLGVTGVATFTAVPVFSSGLGTPTLTGTNITGLPIVGLTGLGTGVATALAVNIGSAGAALLFNGAGGTPSSMTGTNITGLPAAAILAGVFGTGAYTFPGALAITGAFTGATTGAFSGAVTTGTINGQTISSAANFTGTMAVAGNLTVVGKAYFGDRSPLEAWVSINAATGPSGIDPINVRSGEFIVTKMGRVGIGTATPTSTLQVAGDITATTGAFSGAITTGTINGQTISSAASFTGTVAVAGVATLTAQPILSSLTASSAVATDGSKGLVSVTNTGSGSNVLATSPTLVTPALGTPTALVLTSATGLPAAAILAGTFGAGAYTFPGALAITGAFTGATTGAFSGAITTGTINGQTISSSAALTGSLSITGALTGVTTLATSSTINSQTISSAANFTGTVGIAGLLTVSGFGTHTFGTGGTGANSVVLLLDAGSASGVGPAIRWKRNSVDLGWTGIESHVLGTNSNSLILQGSSADGVSIQASNASGTIRFYAGGTTEYMRIASSGYVGIGTTGPEQQFDLYTAGADPTTILQIRANRNAYGNVRANLKTYAGGSTSLDRFTVNIGSSGDALNVLGNGNVGIGTTAPENKLHIYAGSAGTVTAHDQGTLTIESSGTGGINILTPVAEEGVIYFGSPTSSFRSAILYNHTADKMFFRTAGNVTQVTIDNGGRVGIGTTSPNAPLAVKGGVNSGSPYRAVIASFQTASYDQWLSITGDGSGAAGGMGLQYGTGTGVPEIFLTTGKVGIGTTAPTAKLEVAEAGTNSLLLLPGSVPTLKAGGTNTDIKIAAVGSGGHIYFDNNSATSMTILNTGNVGIGTTGPSYKLQVDKAAGYPSDSTFPEAAIAIKDSGSNRRIGFGTGSTGNWIQSSYPGVSGPAYELILNPSGGNVGIGTTSPSATLDIGTGNMAIGTSVSPSGYDLKIRSSTSILGIHTTSATGNPTLEFGTGSSGSAIIRVTGADPLIFNVNGAVRWKINSSGHLNVGADGTYDVGDSSTRIRTLYQKADASTGTAAIIASDGALRPQSSSARYKENITPLVLGESPTTISRDVLSAFLAVTPSWWDYIDQKNGAMGFISETLDALPIKNRYGSSPFINYNADGQVESNRDFAIIGMQHLVLQQHESRLASLNAEVATLTAQLAALEAQLREPRA